ncbi:MAG: nicotinate-nucleotide--dimethylbenzimidazole phosphoribosyltransferase [Eubacterium sp.]|nr:nicotinate-nucleotide--dimethylbenzimidazole phosphoribosyltransferase [Eubacterium sp.]
MEKLTLNHVIESVEPKDPEWEAKACAHVEALAIPPWSLGQVLTLGVQLCGIQRTLNPHVDKKMILTMAADHGIAEEGVSAFPQEVTLQMVGNIVAGGAGVNVLGKASGAEVRLVDMGVKADMPELVASGKIIDAKIAHGSENFHKGPAMTREQAIAALEAGINVATQMIVEEGVELLGTGDLGIGNTTPSTAILAVMGEYPVTSITGRGTGLNNAALMNKIKVIREAIALNKPDKNDALDVLSKVGGYDIAGIAGVILGAAYNKVPVVVDGFISTAGALIAKGLCPGCADYMIASHQSEEPGHQMMWQTLNMHPLLNLNFRLGEGTGAAVAMHLVECAARCLNDMLTFEDAGVTNGLA